MTAMPSPVTLAYRGRGDWRSSIMFFCIALMEILWVGPMLYVVLQSALLEDPLPMPLENLVLIVGGNVIVGLTLRRLLIHARWSFGRQRIPLLIAIPVMLVVNAAVLPTFLDDAGDVTLDIAAEFDLTQSTVPNGVLIAPIVLMMFSRGATIGRFPPAPENVTIQARLGIAGFFFAALLASPDVYENMSVLLPAFFAAMLLASALSRSATLKMSDDMRQQRFGGSWFGFLMMSTLGVTFAGLLVSVLLGVLDEDQVRRALELPFAVFLGAVILLLTPVAYVLALLLEQIPIVEDDPPPAEDIGDGVRETQPAADNPQIDISDEFAAVTDFLDDWVPFLLLASVIGLVLFFWVSFFLMPDNQQLDDEESESIGERERIGSLGAAIARQLKKLGNVFNSVGQFGTGRDLFAAFTIRWAYSRMERMGRKRGFPRQKAQTPYEYRTLLSQAFPDGDDAILTITNAYVTVRYGELPEDENALSDVRLALDALKAIPAPDNP